MFTPPSTIISRCREKLLPPMSKGGLDGKVTLMFSQVKIKGKLFFQLDIISTPKNYDLGKMMFQTSVVFRSANIASFEKPMTALISAIDKTKGLSIGQIECNYFKTSVAPITESEITQLIAINTRLCEYIVNNGRRPIDVVATA